MKIYGVYKQKDMTEGRGSMVFVCCFTKECDAWSYANKQTGIMGRYNGGDWRSYSGGRDWDVKPLECFQSFEESAKAYENKLRESALSKLSEEEKEVLGLC